MDWQYKFRGLSRADYKADNYRLDFSITTVKMLNNQEYGGLWGVYKYSY